MALDGKAGRFSPKPEDLPGPIAVPSRTQGADRGPPVCSRRAFRGICAA